MTVAALPEALHHEALVRSGGWFAALPPDLQRRLFAAAQVRQFSAGQRLFVRGDAADGLYCVVRGAVRVGAISAAGKQALLAIVEPPSWFGEIAFFDALARTHDAWTEAPVTVLHVPQAALQRIVDEQPQYWRSLALLLTHKLRMSFAVIEEATLLPPAGRLASRLLAMAQGLGESAAHTRREVQVSQEQLGQMLSLSRQTVNQLLRQFETQGTLRLRRSGVEILDLERLRQEVAAPDAARPPPVAR